MRLINGRRKLRLLMLLVLCSSIAACGGGGGGGGSSPANAAPVASAGPDQTIFKGEATQLDGSGSSDADGNPLTYSWVQTSGASVALSSATASRPTFTAPRVSGELSFNLTVSDGRATSSADAVTIVVMNRVPTAVAGPDRSVTFDSLVTLAGSNSFDPDNDGLTYTWVQTHGAPVTLEQRPNGDATFTAPMHPAVFEFSLTVSDGALTSNADTVAVSVGGAQVRAPYVDAGYDQTYPRNSTVMLMGWVYDETGTPVSISWRQTAGPPVTLANADGPTPTFEAPDAPAEFEFELTAANGYLTSPPDHVRVYTMNYAPAVNVALAPLAPTTLDDLSATVEIFDADGDPTTSTYVWRRNGNVLPGFAGASLPDTQFVKGDEIELTVTANDGFEDAAQSFLVTVVDSPAVFTATPPTSVDYGETFAFTITATDVDENDPVDAFRLHHGPAGMAVSDAGAVSWPAVLPMFGRSQDVNYSIELVGNEARFDAVVRVEDATRAAPLRRTGIEIPARDGALKIVDLDADGDQEVLIAASQVLYELAWDGAGYVQRWAYPFRLDNTVYGRPTIDAADVVGDDRAEIFVAAGAKVMRLDAATRTVEAQLDLRTNEICKKIELADLDRDNDLDLVCLLGTDSYYGTASFVVVDPVAMTITLRTLEFGGFNSAAVDMAIGNLDNDAALELASGAGYVFDGASGASEWVYGPGFGSLLDAGDVDGDGVDEIVGVQNWTAVRVFDVIARSPVWDLPVSDTAAVLVRDVQGDNAEEILIGDGQWGEVSAYRFDAATSQPVQLWAINSQGHGVTTIEAGNIDGDAGLEFVWGTDATSSGPDSVVVAGLNPTIGVEWINDDPKQLSGPFIGGAYAELSPGMGRLMFGAVSSDNGYGGAALLALDPSAGVFTISDETGTNWSNALALDVVDYDEDGEAEVFLGTSDFYSGYLTAYNALTNTEEWRSPADIGVAQAIVHADYSGDGYADMIAITSGGSLGGPRIHVFDPRNSTLVWRSVALTGSPVDIAVAQIAGNNTPEIIAATHDRVTIYQRSGAAFLEIGSYLANGIIDMLVADVDLNGAQEIYIIESTYGPRTVKRLSPQLALEASYPAPLAQSLHLEELSAARRNLVLSVGDPYVYYAGDAPYLRAIDAMSGAEVWRSPALPATTPRNSLFYVDPDQDGRPQISFAAGASMLLTR